MKTIIRLGRWLRGRVLAVEAQGLDMPILSGRRTGETIWKGSSK